MALAPRNYGLIQTLDELKRLVDRLYEGGNAIGFDVETGYHGPDNLKGALKVAWEEQFIAGFSLTDSPQWARYVPLGHDLANNLPEEAAWEVMKPLLEERPIVAHHAKFEQKNLLALEAKGRGPAIQMNVEACTMLEAYVLSEWKQVGLKPLVFDIFGHKMTELASFFPTAKARKTMRFNILDLSPQVVEYGCEDAAWCLALHLHYGERAKSEVSRMWQLEHKISDLLATGMEARGMNVEWEEMRVEREVGKAFLGEMERATKRLLSEMADGADLSTLNLGSPAQIQQLLYRDLGMATTRLTGSAQKDKDGAKGKEAWQRMSTDQKAMEGLSRKYGAVKKLLEWREVGNAVKRFDKWLDENSDSADGRVHPNFSQVTVGTGRFAADMPPVQQMPKEWRFTTEPDVDVWDSEAWGRVVAEGIPGKTYWTGNFRDYVSAPAGHYFLGYDYSQIELRVLAGLSQEPALLSAFAQGIDVHTATAAMMLALEIEKVRSQERAIGKTMNFALVYGMGVAAMAEQLALPLEEAQRLYQSYFEVFQGVKAFMDRVKTAGLETKFATTWAGRRFRVWDLDSNQSYQRAKGERVLGNAPIQGGAADYMKFAMLRARAALEREGLWNTKVWMVHNLHDALLFEVHESVDPNWLRGVLEEAVVYPVKTPEVEFPVIVADWEIGQRHGSCSSWAAGQEAFWDGEFWRLRDVEGYVAPEVGRKELGVPTVTAPAPVEAPPEPARAPKLEVDLDAQPRRLEVILSRMPLRSEVEAFMALVRENPGPHSVVLILPEGVSSVPLSVGFDHTNGGAISMALPGAMIRESPESVDLSRLEGLGL
jgi:DNA polymerase-1